MTPEFRLKKSHAGLESRICVMQLNHLSA